VSPKDAGLQNPRVPERKLVPPQSPSVPNAGQAGQEAALLTIREDWKRKGTLYKGKKRNINAELRRVLGEEAASWLKEPKLRFGGRSPEQVIKDGEQFWVRDVLRSYVYGGVSPN
jgi:Protein of unknown function (DUF2384)